MIIPSIISEAIKKEYCAELFESSAEVVYFSTDLQFVNSKYLRSFFSKGVTQMEINFSYISETKKGASSEIIKVQWNRKEIFSTAVNNCAMQSFQMNLTTIEG